MGLLASKFCKAGPGKYSPTSSRDAETFVKWVEEDADGVNDRLLAVMNILVRQHGMAQTCDMLFVESIIMKPGSKP